VKNAEVAIKLIEKTKKIGGKEEQVKGS